MDKQSVEIETRRSPGESSSSTQSAESAKDGQTRGTKRKASPEQHTPRKRMRVSESGPQSSSEEVTLKRKVRDDTEGPPKKRRRIRRIDRGDTGKASSSNPSEDCRTSEEDVRKRLGKRKAEKGDAPSRKKTRRPDLKESKKDLVVDAQRAEFEAKYEQQNQLGEGGCGCVFAGFRKADHLPVAIKHIPNDNVWCKHVGKNGVQLSVEVAIMLKLAAETTGSVGTSAPVSLLDWYDLDQELILVLERPIPSVDLSKYVKDNGGSLQEEKAKIILKQLVDAAKELEDRHIFHRDIKVENILIETASDVPRVRLIDFGLGCFVKKRSFYRDFYGTTAHTPPEWSSRGTYRAGPTTAWQMGVVLFESLHSEAPFRTTEFIKNNLTINDKLSKDCQDFLRACLTEAPEQRPTLKQLQDHPWLR